MTDPTARPARIRLRARPRGPAGRDIAIQLHAGFDLATVTAPAGWWRIVGAACYGKRDFDPYAHLVPATGLDRTLALLCAAAMSRTIVHLCRANRGYCDQAMLRGEGWSPAAIRALGELAIGYAADEVREIAA